MKAFVRKDSTNAEFLAIPLVRPYARVRGNVEADGNWK